MIGILEKDCKKIQIDRKDQNDPKRIHARGAELTAPRRQGAELRSALLFCSLGDRLCFHFWLFLCFKNQKNKKGLSLKYPKYKTQPRQTA
ncbi:hypothetical protein RCS94_11300 [Orbaceae bacterium ac157xtp]